MSINVIHHDIQIINFVVFKPGTHWVQTSVCMCVCVCVSAPEAINN